MNKRGQKRLAKARDWLRATDFEKGDKGFDFHLFITMWDDKNECGSVCCLLGWMPEIDPENWSWENSLSGIKIRYKNAEKWQANYDPFNHAAQYFDITYEAAEHLFIPSSQNQSKYGGYILDSFATPKQVARNIDIFLKRVDRGLVK